MKVAVDLHCLQTPGSRNRGIGFFTQDQMRAVLSVDDRNDYLLLANGYLPEPELFRSLPTSARWRALLLDSPANRNILPDGHYSRDEEFRHRSYVESILVRDEVDLMHVASPFEHHAYTPLGYRTSSVIATVYDVIPLVFEEQYLVNVPSATREKYLSVCDALSGADRIITISECSKSDICRYLGVSPDRVDVVFAAAKDCFVQLADHQAIDRARSALGLDQGYILCPSGADHRKNVERVIESFSLLPLSLRRRNHLVIQRRVGPEEAARLREIARSFGVEERLVLTDYVSDDTLAALYNGASVVLFPTLYEGFGLPVLEAFHCGAPVVTSNVSSLPEVAGDAALLVDPYSPREIADAVERLLVSPDLQAELRAKGRKQATAFSSEQVALRTLAAYAKAVSSGSVARALDRVQQTANCAQQGRLRIAYFSPLNPRQPRISDLSGDLLARLSEYLDVDLFVDGCEPSNQVVTGRFPAFDYRNFETVAARRQYALNVYQIGNSHDFQYVYQTLLRYPGIVVLNDVVLHRLIYEQTVMLGHPEKYVEESEFCHGERGAAEARQEVERGTALEGLCHVAVNRRVINAALGVITHSDWARREVEACCLNVPVARVSPGVEIFDDDLAPEVRAAVLAELNIPDDASFVVSSFGAAVPSGGLITLTRAFARLLRRYPDAILLFTGQIPAPGITGLIDDLGMTRNVRVIGHVGRHKDRRSIANYLRVSDVGVNLRYPRDGETSAAVIKMMGLGKPQIISDLSQLEEIPENCCWKLADDEHEEDLLVAYLLEMASNFGLRRDMGENARRYARTNHSMAQSVDGYSRFVSLVLSRRGTPSGFVATLLPTVEC